MAKEKAKEAKFEKLKERALKNWAYLSQGVWQDERRSWKISVIKTLNLSMRSFFNSDIQTQACAMTYRTLLAIVPALALLFAIGKGFGMSGDLQEELYTIFPAQKTAINYAMSFIDSYLKSYSEGVFVGVGVVFLLYTLISLFSNIEETFNLIWGVKDGRSFGRKIVDYTAMLLILPVVMLCASGLSITASTTLQNMVHWEFMTPIIKWVLEGLSWLMTFAFFTLLYLLMPNAKVKLANAALAGVFAGIGFRLLQWAFVSGQLYVSRYNAIYGSFSFLPLMLLWTQLTWVIIFAGGVICYSSQNIFMYSYNEALENISSSYYAKLTLAICAVVVQRFMAGEGATTAHLLVTDYRLPPRLDAMICNKLVRANILSVVDVDAKRDIKGYQPALDPDKITVELVFSRLDQLGSSNFIGDFDKNFPGVAQAYGRMHAHELELTSKMKLTDINVKKIIQ